MKAQALNALQIAKVLLDQSLVLSLGHDQHSSSAALVVLQDAVELVFLAALTELGVDDTTSIESMAFDQLVGALRKHGVPVPKSGTIKAMNKHRTLVKHYGQMSDATSVSAYLDASKDAIDAILKHTFGLAMAEVYLSGLVEDAESRPHLDRAAESIEREEYWSALVEIRKAIFIEIEVQYCIDGYLTGKPQGILGLGLRGWRSPWHTRDAAWISKNVKSVFDYIQLDHERLRLDLLEWGINTEDYWNIWRLTPKVYQDDETKAWFVERDWQHVSYAPTKENAKYCLDRSINIIASKRRHARATKSLAWGARLSVEIATATPLRERADDVSTALELLEAGSVLTADGIVIGFDLATEYAHIAHIDTKPFSFKYGFVPLNVCRILSSE
jgi:hypothetical protein